MKLLFASQTTCVADAGTHAQHSNRVQRVGFAVENLQHKFVNVFLYRNQTLQRQLVTPPKTPRQRTKQIFTRVRAALQPKHGVKRGVCSARNERSLFQFAMRNKQRAR